MKTTRSLSLLLGMLLALPASAGQTYFNSNGCQLNVGWQDSEGQPQQLSYRLEAGKLPPLRSTGSSGRSTGPSRLSSENGRDSGLLPRTVA